MSDGSGGSADRDGSDDSDGSDSGGDGATLRRRYRELVDGELPAAAAREGWPIRRDHCFGRVLLDDAVGGRWYDVLGRGRGAAYRRLDDEQLAHAVAQGERMLREGESLVRRLNHRSLAWRGKPRT